MTLGSEIEKFPKRKHAVPFSSGLHCIGSTLDLDILHHLQIVRLCFIRRHLGIYVDLDSDHVSEDEC